MDVRELLRALALTIPDARIHLRLADDRVVVGLCDQPAGKFYDAALEEADHARPVADVAAEIAEFYKASRAGRVPRESER